MTRSEQIALEIIDTLRKTRIVEWMSAQSTWQYGRTGHVNRAHKLLKQWGVFVETDRRSVWSIDYSAPAFGEPTISYTASV